MTEQHFEDLAKRWPDLFQKSGDFELSVGVGWYNIVDILCSHLSYDVETARRRLKYAMENPKATFATPIAELEKNVEVALENLPTIQQVKEKFGTMRFYVNGGSEKMHHHIEFAESMTARTCEVCGSPGESRTGGWVRVLCDKHSREQDEKDEVRTIHMQAPTSVKLSDE